MEPLLNEKFSSNSDFFIESHEFEEMWKSDSLAQFLKNYDSDIVIFNL